MALRVGAYAVVVDAGRVLLAHWRGDGRWVLPGGGIEPGEDPADAVVRELLDGTTDTAAWFALDEVAGLRRVELVDVALRLAGHAERPPERAVVLGSCG